MQPTPKSLILDLLSSARGRPIPVKALIAAGGVFEIRAESVRVALTRLCERGMIERNERGQYRVAAAAEPVQRHVAGWTRLDQRVVAWKGGWIGVHTADLSRRDRARVRRSERALHLLGFRRLAVRLFVRPDNLAGGVAALRAELHELGLEAEAMVFGLTGLDAASDARARQLWDAAALRRDYRETRAALARSAQRLARLSAPQAMVESFVLGGRAIRQLALDPLLPEAIVPAAERGALITALRDYDRRGRACWRPLMQAHGGPHLEERRVADTHWAARAAGGT